MNLTWLAAESSYSHSSLALPLLHAAATGAQRVRWHVVRATTKEHVPTVVARISEQAPDVLAATVYLFNRSFVLAVLRRVKALLPRCRVVLGGPEFLGDNGDFLRAERAVDVVVRGEGEVVFAEWLRCIRQPGRWTRLPGLCWRDDSGNVCQSAESAEIPDINALPSPHASSFFEFDKPFAQLETSRGCAGTCAFCTSAGSRRVRCMDLARVRETLLALTAGGVREIRVLDRTFNSDQRRAVKLLRMFLEEFPNVRFHLEMHPRLLGPGLRRALSAAPPGRLHVEVGLQTTCEAALRACRRQADTARSLDGLAFLCGLRNLDVHVDLLAGLPRQTMADVQGDLALLSGLAPAEIQLETLKVLPGTPLSEEAAGLGVVFAPDAPYEVLQTPQMPAADLHRCRLLSRVVDGYYNHAVLHGIVQPAAARSAHFFPEVLAYLLDRVNVEEPASLRRRFELLHGFLSGCDHEACDELEIAWLSCGFSPAHGICPAELWRSGVPEHAALARGDADAVGRSDARTWYVDQRTRECWVVLEREPDGRPRCAALFTQRQRG